MSTSEMTVSLPFHVSEDEAKLLFAVKLYEVGKITLGQAAKLAGHSKRAFIEILGRHQIAVFNYPAEELQQELTG